MVKMRAPEDCAETLYWDGVIYQADKRRVFTLPDDAEPMLTKHGFARIAETPKQAKRK